MSRNATIVIAGITITAPSDLVSAAGYEPYCDGSPSRSRWPIAEQRLMRAMSEMGVATPRSGPLAHQIGIEGMSAIRLLLRVVELAELERTDNAKTEQLRLVAQTEARAAADNRAAAGIAITAQRLAMGASKP